MYSTEPNPNGVWTHIVAHTPRPEVEELAKIIGKKSIDKNENLWQELCALKEIVADFLTFEFGNMKLATRTGNSPERNVLRNNEMSSQSRHNNDEDSAMTKTVFQHASIDDFISFVKDSLTVSKVHDVLPLVHEALANEQTELEAEIALMQTTMDTESEVISRGNTPRRDNIVSESFSSTCSSSNDDSNTLSSTEFHHDLSRKLSESASAPVHKSVVIIGPGRIRRSDSRTNDKSSVVNSKVSNSLVSNDLSRQSFDLNRPDMVGKCPSDRSIDQVVEGEGGFLNDPSPSSSRNNSGNGSKSTRSRMRSRIETARDERFFMDDDIFMR